VLEVLCSSVEGSFGAGRATALPELAEVALLFQTVSDVGGTVAKVGRGRRSRREEDSFWSVECLEKTGSFTLVRKMLLVSYSPEVVN
jgi:hypothetical protein